MVAHHKIHIARDAHRPVVAQVLILRRNVGLRKRLAIHIDDAAANLYDFIGQRDDALDERFAAVQRIPENDHVTALNRLKAVHKFIDEDAFLIGKERRHAGAFDFHRLIEKNDDDEGEPNGDEKIARPDADFALERLSRCWFFIWRNWGLFRD